MTKIITNAEAHARRNRDIQPLIKRLKALHPQADPNVLTRFARGLAALSGIPGILNAEGLRLLQSVESLMQAKSPLLTDIEGVLPQLPSIETPHLHLFINPFPEAVLNDPQFRAFKAWFNEEGGYRIIQIATGCQNNCLMCGASPYGIGEKQGKIRFMPFPMILLLAKQLIKEKSKAKIMPYFNSDAMQWRDKNFDADLGDLAKQLSILDIELTDIVTLGLWPTSIYGVEAARKCADIGTIFRLSLHLLNKRVFPTSESEPQEKWLERYAERFAFSINTLRPQEVSLQADKTNPNEYFRHDYLKEFYDQRIFPRIDEGLKENYGIKNQKFTRLGLINYEGRAYHNLYFSGRDWYRQSIVPKGFHLRVKADGEFSVLIPTSSEALEPQLFRALSVKERYRTANSNKFRDFLMKLRFMLLDEALFETSATLTLWKKIYPQFKREDVLGILSPNHARLDLPTQILKILHRKLGCLPISSQELYYTFRVKDLRKGAKYHYLNRTFKNPDRVVSERSFGLDMQYVFALLIKEGFINEKGELQPKLLKATRFFSEYKGFKLSGFYMGSFPKSKALEIFDSEDPSWSKFFENPDAENLVFKKDAYTEIKYADIYEDERQKLFSLWQQFLRPEEVGQIFETLRSAYYDNLEYRFLMSFDEGRDAVQKIMGFKPLFTPGGKFDLELIDPSYEILCNLPILRPVRFMQEGGRRDVTHLKREAILDFRANTGIS